ncbi:MAG: ComF family protein [Candidatus Zixiibacteriota bacterium]
MIHDSKILDKIGLNGLIDFIYPPLCLCCDDYLDNGELPVCPDCIKNLPQLDYPFCNNCRQFLENKAVCSDCGDLSLPVFCLGYFTDDLQKMIHQFKYHGFKRLGGELAARLADKYLEKLKHLAADFILPAPLHSIREKSRGFNQAAILADIIGSRIGIPVVTEALMKIRRTKDQAKLNPEQRRKNIKGAFKMSDFDILNKRIVITDDVVTTGATVNEIALTLREAGGIPVAVCAIAAAGF